MKGLKSTNTGRNARSHGGKPNNFNKAAGGSKSNKKSSVKNQIRDVKRLLSRPNLDEGLKARQEKKLLELEQQYQEHLKREKERQLAVRYHKVRFFERVKLERRLKKLQAQPPSDALTAKIQDLEEDLEYVQHFPKGEKYVSLLKDATDPDTQIKLESERARLRALVKQQLAEEALLADADEGRSLAAPGGATARAIPAPLNAHHSADDSEDSEAGSSEEDDFFMPSDDEVKEKNKHAMKKVVVEQGSEEEFHDAEEEIDSDDDSEQDEDEEESSDDDIVPSTRAADPSGRGTDRGGDGSDARHKRSGSGAPMRGNRNGTALPNARPSAARSSQSKKRAKPGKEDDGGKQPLRKRAEGGRKRRKKK